ncbi:MAG: hypothetical protein IJR07_05820 [Bacteroidaceae bacterium]|nr:hypothetical protein [Bacteroidaceae bacterium]
MKKLITLLVMALLLVPAQQADAQGFLKKALNKAKELTKSTQTVEEEEEEEDDSSSRSTSRSSRSNSDDDGGLGVASAKEQLQPKRQSTLTWDEAVVPSTASSADALMKELPAVPSVAQLIEPDEDTQILYYRAIKKVSIRAEELNEDATCDDEYTKQWRDKANQILKDLGLSDADIKALENDNLSDAERERISQKVAKAVLGDGFDMSALDNMESMDENAMIRQMTSKTDAIYDKYDAQLRKYTGIPASEYKKASAMAATNPDAADKQMDALSKRAQAYSKQKSATDPNLEKEAKAFGQKLSAELMQAQQSASPMAGMGNLNDLMNNVNQMQSKMASIQQTQQAMNQYVNKIQKLLPESELAAGDVSFAAAERKKVEDLKKQIYSTDNASVYNPLYLQALEMIKTYRQRVAKLWHDDLVKRVNQLKQNMPQAISIQRQAIKDELIPECALWRVPLNLVIHATDVLGEAYAEFPSEYPPMYNEEVVQTIKITDGYGFMYPESQVSASVDDALRGKGLYKTNSAGEFYEWNNGSWKAVEYKAAMNDIKKVQKPESATWTSQDGKRTVRYNAEGGFISLPEGDEVAPRAWEVSSSRIIWVDYYISIDDTTGDETLQIKKCTYKL